MTRKLIHVCWGVGIALALTAAALAQNATPPGGQAPNAPPAATPAAPAQPNQPQTEQPQTKATPPADQATSATFSMVLRGGTNEKADADKKEDKPKDWRDLLVAFKWPISALGLLVFVLLSAKVRSFLEDVGNRITKLKGAGIEVELSIKGAQDVRANIETTLTEFIDKADKEYARAVGVARVWEGLQDIMQTQLPAILGRKGVQPNAPQARGTIHVPDIVYEDYLYQLTKYYVTNAYANGNAGIPGRRFSKRYGIIGRAWRLEESLGIGDALAEQRGGAQSDAAQAAQKAAAEAARSVQSAVEARDAGIAAVTSAEAALNRATVLANAHPNAGRQATMLAAAQQVDSARQVRGGFDPVTTTADAVRDRAQQAAAAAYLASETQFAQVAEAAVLQTRHSDAAAEQAENAREPARLSVRAAREAASRATEIADGAAALVRRATAALGVAQQGAGAPAEQIAAEQAIRTAAEKALAAAQAVARHQDQAAAASAAIEASATMIQQVADDANYVMREAANRAVQAAAVGQQQATVLPTRRFGAKTRRLIEDWGMFADEAQPGAHGHPAYLCVVLRSGDAQAPTGTAVEGVLYIESPVANAFGSGTADSGQALEVAQELEAQCKGLANRLAEAMKQLRKSGPYLKVSQ